MKICCDIDGVLADVRPYVEKYLPHDWDEYFKHTEEFKPIPTIVRLVNTLRASHEVYLVTGRPNDNRAKTEKWIQDNILTPEWYGYCGVLMRKDDDFRPTHEIKMEWFRKLKPDLIIDDDPAVVEAATKEGFIVLQVHGFRATGNGNDMTPHFTEREEVTK